MLRLPSSWFGVFPSLAESHGCFYAAGKFCSTQFVACVNVLTCYAHGKENNVLGPFCVESCLATQVAPRVLFS